MFTDRELLDDALRNLCDVIFSQHLRPPAAYLVERTPVHVFQLELINRIYPDALIVNVLRDGRDVVRSLLHQPWGPSTVHEAAQSWRESILAARAAAPARYLEVRYENLVERPETAARDLFDRAGIPRPDPSWISAETDQVKNADPVDVRVGVGKWRSSFSADDMHTFDAVAGDLLVELGYAASGWHKDDDSPSQIPAKTAERPTAVERSGTHDWRVLDIHGDPPNGLSKAQRQFETLIGAIQSRDRARLSGLISPDARLRVHGYPGLPTDLPGIDELLTVLNDDPAFDGLQTRGDIVPSYPVFSAVLSYEGKDGRGGHRVLYAVLDATRIRALALYRLAR